MIYFGLDLGTNSLGISINNELNIVFGVENYNFSKGNYKKAREHLLDIIEIENVKNIVIGYPVQLDLKEGERCESVKRFVEDLLKAKPDLKIYYCDESYTTIEARERLREQGVKEEKIKKIIDMMSAVVILEDYLRSMQNGTIKR